MSICFCKQQLLLAKINRVDSFPFDFEPNGIPFGSKSKWKLSMLFILANHSCCLQKQMDIELQVKRLYSLVRLDSRIWKRASSENVSIYFASCPNFRVVTESDCWSVGPTSRTVLSEKIIHQSSLIKLTVHIENLQRVSELNLDSYWFCKIPISYYLGYRSWLFCML